MVNGCLADMWSFACILYEMLTGEKLFELEDEEALFTWQAPPEVANCLRKQWLLYDAVAEAQRDWVSYSLTPLHMLHLSLYAVSRHTGRAQALLYSMRCDSNAACLGPSQTCSLAC